MSGVPPVQSRLNHSSAMDLDPWASSPIQASIQSDWPDCFEHRGGRAFYPVSYEWSVPSLMHAYMHARLLFIPQRIDAYRFLG